MIRLSVCILLCTPLIAAVPDSAFDDSRDVWTSTGNQMAERGFLRRLQLGERTIARPETVLLHSRDGGRYGVLPLHWFRAVYVDSRRSLVRLER